MELTAKIYIAGHRGMVGSGLERKLRKEEYNNIVTRTSSELDLRNQHAVNNFFEKEKPEDFVLATGITTTIRDFVKMSFAELGIELGFRGKDEAEEGYVVKNISEYKLEEGTVIVKVDPKYYRPTEVDLLIGDPTKAMTKLGWKPKYDLAALVKEMVASDVSLFKKELYIKQSGL